VVHNPGAIERGLDRLRRRIIAWMATPAAAPTPLIGQVGLAQAAE
jgi:hypothetical protein